MPHFVIDCSESIIKIIKPETIMLAVLEEAKATELFELKNIKVRINPYKLYNTAGGKDDFIHVFGNIMGGRNTDQKKLLSKRIVTKLKELFPDVMIISMNIMDFEKETYCNRGMV